jgi:glycosyltransferase involved in cell wall biosynthesis
VNTYGIYLAYPPETDLRAQGLGRLLAEFLKQTKGRADVKFVIACPSWMRSSLSELLDESGVQLNSFEIIGPEEKPLILKLFEIYRAYKKRKRRIGRLFRGLVNFKLFSLRMVSRAERAAAGTRSILFLSLLILIALPFLAIGATARFGKEMLVDIRILMRAVGARSTWYSGLRRYSAAVSNIIALPQSNLGMVRVYRHMEDAEAQLLRKHINGRPDISAWYSPTAFWPHFNLIASPKLMCVPDIVLSEFPIGFSSVGGDRTLEIFRLLKATIEGGDHFVTYSKNTKWRTLVDRYHVSPNDVTVVPHGANRLDQLVVVSGAADSEAATRALCVNVFGRALRKAVNLPGATNFNSGDVRFIFFATQFRPSKNVVSLLRAYDYLLKRRYIGHKLVLTGHPDHSPQVANFISEHNLQNDVLCLYGLTAQELAACYRLADLAVNPSLSEGGCPFTLTEALSVGTPVVMARIAVTEEVVTDPELRGLMLFDPYDWEDIAARIEWALQNKEGLLESQLKLYERLAERSWRTVVDEYVAILDRISSPSV